MPPARTATGPARAAALAGLAAAPLLGLAAAEAGPQALLLAALAAAFALLVRWPILGVHALVAGTFFDELHLPAGFALLGTADLAALALLPAWITRRLFFNQPPLAPTAPAAPSQTTTNHLPGRAAPAHPTAPAEARPPRPTLAIASPEDAPDPRLRLPAAWPLLAAYLALAFASLLLGVAPHTAYGGYARLLTYAAAVIALADLIRHPRTLRHIALTMALCGLAHALISLADPAPARRLMGLADQPNILAVRLALGALPAAWLWSEARRPLPRWLWGLALTLMLLAIALTISRGTYLALTAAFLWWLRRSPRLALAIALAAITSYALLHQLAEDRITRIERRLDFDDSSVTHRGVVARNALAVITQRPLLGVGFGQFRALDEVVGVTDQAGRGSHNFYLGVAASTGLPALALLLAFALRQARGLARRGAPDPNDALARLLPLWQAIAVYHAASLIVRGGLRLTDWTLLGLYAAVALLNTRDHPDPPPPPTPEAP